MRKALIETTARINRLPDMGSTLHECADPYEWYEQARKICTLAKPYLVGFGNAGQLPS